MADDNPPIRKQRIPVRSDEEAWEFLMGLSDPTMTDIVRMAMFAREEPVSIPRELRDLQDPRKVPVLDSYAVEAMLDSARYYETTGWADRGPVGIAVEARKFKDFAWKPMKYALWDGVRLERNLGSKKPPSYSLFSIDGVSKNLAAAEDLYEVLEDQVTVRDLVDQLPPRQRQVVVLYYYIGFSSSEISSLLGIAKSSVRAAKHIALDKIETSLNADYGFGPRTRNQFFSEIDAEWEKDEDGRLSRLSERILDPMVGYTEYLDHLGISRSVQREMKTGLIGDSPTRLLIPHFFGGKLIGWTSRLITEQVGPKYRTSSDFGAAKTVYNYDQVSGLGRVVVVESPLSVLRLMTEGVPDAVALFGAPATSAQTELLRDFEEVVIFFDGNHQGAWAADDLAADLDSEAKVRVVNLHMDSGLTPADQRLSGQDLRELVSKAQSQWPGRRWRGP